MKMIKSSLVFTRLIYGIASKLLATYFLSPDLGEEVRTPIFTHLDDHRLTRLARFTIYAEWGALLSLELSLRLAG